jgi:exonuclease SbcD
VPAEYAGSLLQLDFGEAGEEKRVALVDVTAGIHAAVSSVPITRGRPLVRVSGPWSDIVDRTDLDDAFLDLVVATDGPQPGLMDEARERFEHVVKVRAEYEREELEGRGSIGAALDELYAGYHAEAHGAVPPDALMSVFREIIEEADRAAS